jgi:GntR family transcriptional regulator
MDQVRHYIASGILRPGDQLPSIRELASVLAVNPTTVVRVYTELEREGTLEMRHGKGAFVAPRAASPRGNEAERVEGLRRSARQLAVEAVQAGVGAGRLAHLVSEEMERLQPARAAQDDEPVRFRVVSGGKT